MEFIFDTSIWTGFVTQEIEQTVEMVKETIKSLEGCDDPNPHQKEFIQMLSGGAPVVMCVARQIPYLNVQCPLVTEITYLKIHRVESAIHFDLLGNELFPGETVPPEFQASFVERRKTFANTIQQIEESGVIPE